MPPRKSTILKSQVCTECEWILLTYKSKSERKKERSWHRQRCLYIFQRTNSLVKTFSKSQIINNKSLFLVARVEKEALQILEHPNVIKLLSTFQTELNLYMVFKYYPKSTCNNSQTISSNFYYVVKKNLKRHNCNFSFENILIDESLIHILHLHSQLIRVNRL